MWMYKSFQGAKIIECWLKNNNIYFTKEETFNKSIGLKTGKYSYFRFDIYVPSKI